MHGRAVVDRRIAKHCLHIFSEAVVRLLYHEP
jgi:hypothetical protein